jgi:hypothetical protein
VRITSLLGAIFFFTCQGPSVEDAGPGDAGNHLDAGADAGGETQPDAGADAGATESDAAIADAATTVDAAAPLACDATVHVGWTDFTGNTSCSYFSGPLTLGTEYRLGESAELSVAGDVVSLSFGTDAVFRGLLEEDGSFTLTRGGDCDSAPFYFSFLETIEGTVGSDCTVTASYRYLDCNVLAFEPTDPRTCEPTPASCTTSDDCTRGDCIDGLCIDVYASCMLTAQLDASTSTGGPPDDGPPPDLAAICTSWCAHRGEIATETSCRLASADTCMSDCTTELTRSCTPEAAELYDCMSTLPAASFICAWDGKPTLPESHGRLLLRSTGTSCDSASLLLSACRRPFAPEGTCVLR